MFCYKVGQQISHSKNNNLLLNRVDLIKAKCRGDTVDESLFWILNDCAYLWFTGFLLGAGPLLFSLLQWSQSAGYQPKCEHFITISMAHVVKFVCFLYLTICLVWSSVFAYLLVDFIIVPFSVCFVSCMLTATDTASNLIASCPTCLQLVCDAEHVEPRVFNTVTNLLEHLLFKAVL